MLGVTQKIIKDFKEDGYFDFKIIMTPVIKIRRYVNTMKDTIEVTKKLILLKLYVEIVEQNFVDNVI